MNCIITFNSLAREEEQPSNDNKRPIIIHNKLASKFYNTPFIIQYYGSPGSINVVMDTTVAEHSR